MQLREIIHLNNSLGKKTIIHGLEYTLYSGKISVSCADKNIIIAGIVPGTNIIQHGGFFPVYICRNYIFLKV